MLQLQSSVLCATETSNECNFVGDMRRIISLDFSSLPSQVNIWSCGFESIITVFDTLWNYLRDDFEVQQAAFDEVSANPIIV